MENYSTQYKYKYDYDYDILLKSNDGRKWFYILDKRDDQPIYNAHEKYLLNKERELYQEAQEIWIENYIKMMDDPEYWNNHFHQHEDYMDEKEKEIVLDMAGIKNKKETNVKNEINKKDNNLVVLDSVDKYFSVGENGRKFEPVLLATELDYKYFSTFYDGQLFYYYDNGVYKPYADRKIRQLSQELLGNESRKNRIEEVIYWLKNQNYIENQTVINPNDGYINVKNGLLNWKTGELIEHDCDRLSTIQFNVEYDPKANDPIVMNFINNVLDQDTRTNGGN